MGENGAEENGNRVSEWLGEVQSVIKRKEKFIQLERE
jgi:hypothetical protein